jgi:hypothetical protein
MKTMLSKNEFSAALARSYLQSGQSVVWIGPGAPPELCHQPNFKVFSSLALAASTVLSSDLGKNQAA